MPIRVEGTLGHQCVLADGFLALNCRCFGLHFMLQLCFSNWRLLDDSRHYSQQR